MKRFILTGTPGSGKTSILNALHSHGYAVVHEAATDLICEEQSKGNERPWRDPLFLEKITELQRFRQLQPAAAGAEVQFYDRSPVCTLALARYLGHPVPADLTSEIERIVRERVYEPAVFFVRPLGFCRPTAARRITYQESLVFERYHEDEYRRLGFELAEVPAGAVEERASLVESFIASRSARDAPWL